MPTGKKGGNDQNRQNGGMDRDSGEMNRPIGQGIREGLDDVGHRVREGFDSAKEGVGHGYRRAEGMIARHPAPSLLLGFGLGFGLGIALCSLFVREEETWADRHLPDSLRHLHVPDSIKHVPDQIHHLADALASRLPHAVRKHLA